MFAGRTIKGVIATAAFLGGAALLRLGRRLLDYGYWSLIAGQSSPEGVDVLRAMWKNALQKVALVEPTNDDPETREYPNGVVEISWTNTPESRKTLGECVFLGRREGKA